MASRSGATRGATTPCAPLVPGTLVSEDDASAPSEVVALAPVEVAEQNKVSKIGLSKMRETRN